MWAVGQRNDATSDTPLVEHWNGRSWRVVSVPSAGLTAGLLQAVAVRGGQVWAVGQSDDATHQAFPLIEHLSHGTWTATQPAGLGTGFSDINGVAVTAAGTVWIAGEYLDAATGLQHTLLARSITSGWQQVPAPNPGTGDKTLGGISATGNTAWAVGYFKTNVGRSPLIEVMKPR